MADTSNLETIQTALVQLIKDAAGAANVYSGARLTEDWGSFIDQFRDEGTGLIHGWTVQFQSLAEERLTSLENLTRYTFKIRGYYAVQTGGVSEAEFDRRIMGICDSVRGTHDVTATAELNTPAQVQLKDERAFAGVLVHYTEIQITAQELLAGD